MLGSRARLRSNYGWRRIIAVAAVDGAVQKNVDVAKYVVHRMRHSRHKFTMVYKSGAQSTEFQGISRVSARVASVP